MANSVEPGLSRGVCLSSGVPNDVFSATRFAHGCCLLFNQGKLLWAAQPLCKDWAFYPCTAPRLRAQHSYGPLSIWIFLTICNLSNCIFCHHQHQPWDNPTGSCPSCTPSVYHLFLC